MKRTLIHYLWMFAAMVLLFLFVQKPLFLLYNAGFGGTHPTLADWWDIYRHGLFTDLATVAYLMAMPLLVMLAVWLCPSVTWRSSAPRWWVCFVKVYAWVMAVVVSLGVTADACMYEFWEFKLDRTVFFYITDPKNAAASVSGWYLLGRALMWTLLALLSGWAMTRGLHLAGRAESAENVEDSDQAPLRSLLRKDILAVLLFAVMGGALFSLMRGWRIWPNTPGRAYYTQTAFYNHAAVNPIYNLFYSFTRSEVDTKQFVVFSDEELAALMQDVFPTRADSTEALLRVERPNILLVVLEGFGSCFVEKLGGDPTVGVNINRILDESVVFDSCYCGSFRTDRGIVCAVSGYLGQPTTSIMRFAHKIRHLPGLAARLRENGYITQALYSGDITFFNMSEYFLTAGHDRLVSQDDFPLEQRTTKWGVPDHVAMDWLFHDIQQRTQQADQPWYTTYLTISSHNPFDVPYHRLEDKMFNSFAYTDSCYGDFIDRLRQTLAWDNLLVVTVADHGFNWREMTAPEFPFVPLFMTGGAIKEPRVIHRLVSQTDIPATLLGQLGIAHDDFVFSRDVMGNTYRYPFGFNTFNNGFNLRDSTGCTVFDNDFGRALHGADPQRERQGKAILQTLYQDIANR